jgi:uncharacterized membrane protein
MLKLRRYFFTGLADLIFVPKDEVILPDITIEEALKVIVSGGVINPDEGGQMKPKVMER